MSESAFDLLLLYLVNRAILDDIELFVLFWKFFMIDWQVFRGYSADSSVCLIGDYSILLFNSSSSLIFEGLAKLLLSGSNSTICFLLVFYRIKLV